MGYCAGQLRQSCTCALKKSGDTNNFAEKFGLGRLRHCHCKKARSKRILRMRLKKKSVKFKKKRWPMGTVQSVSKNFEGFSSFSDKNLPNKKHFGKKDYIMSPNWIVIHQLVQKYWQFEAYCFDGTQKYIVFPLKTPEIGLFSPKNRQKNYSPTESSQNYRSLSICSVYTEKGHIRSFDEEKNQF